MKQKRKRPALVTQDAHRKKLAAVQSARLRQYFVRQRRRWEVEHYGPAILQIVIACEHHDRPIPPWVRKALAEQFANYLGAWDDSTKKWEPEITGHVIARIDSHSDRHRPSLDSLIGIKNDAGDRRNKMARYIAENQQRNWLRQVEYIRHEKLELTEKQAVVILEERRNRHRVLSESEKKSAYNRYKQVKHAVGSVEEN